MLLKITHESDLSYTDTISESVMELRMFPRQEQHQHRLSFTLALDPTATVNSYFDWLGNTVHTFSVSGLHQQIRIVVTSVVETEPPVLAPETLPDFWPLPQTSDYWLWDYLQFDGAVVDSPELRELVKDVRARQGMRLGEIGQRLIRLIPDRFEYEKGITTTASPITDVLRHGKGVCQDFAHLMIGLARAMGIPARYVSGLVHPDAERFRGYTQTHAWCELYFPSAGWVGFDPTNSCVVGENFVKIAVGRSYRDVPPSRGLYRGNARESIEVRVSTEPLPFIPADLFPEKITSLSSKAAPGFVPRSRVNAPQEHQQQQQQQQQQQ